MKIDDINEEYGPVIKKTVSLESYNNLRQENTQQRILIMYLEDIVTDLHDYIEFLERLCVD